MEIFGSPRNRTLILNNISKIIALKKFESLSFHKLIEDFKTKDCCWLPNSKSSLNFTLNRKMVKNVLFWIFNYSVWILKSFFYITESTSHKNRVFYYRADSWVEIVASSLPHPSFQHSALRGPYSVARVVPKESGVRWIVNLRKKYSCNNKLVSSSWEGSLKNVKAVLEYEKSRSFSSRSTVLGLQDFYKKLFEYKNKMMERINSKQKMYFLKIDIKNAYDSILHEKLFEIIGKSLKEDEYMIYWYSIIRNFKNGSKVLWKRKAGQADSYQSFLSRDAINLSQFSKSIFIDQVQCDYESKENVLNVIKSHITKNMLKLGGQFYHQTNGIPQGSLLSSLLCSFYYGDMVENHLSFAVSDSQGLILRQVDDFLYISFDKKNIIRFLDKAYHGIPEYGCNVNFGKTLTNFKCKIGNLKLKSLDGNLFPFCGKFINTETLDVCKDITVYYGSYMKDSLTIYSQNNNLMSKLICFVKPRCHPLFTDINFNSRKTVLKNIMETFILCAMKSHVYDKANEQKNMDAVIEELINCVIGMSKTKIPKEIIRLLGYHSFHIIYSRKNTKYRNLLFLLNRKIVNLNQNTCDDDFHDVIKEFLETGAIERIIF